MKKSLLYIIVILFLVASCRIPYDPDINTDKQVLVVDAFLTNHPGVSFVKLTLAIPFDSVGSYPRVRKATVFLTDNTDSVFMYKEVGAGLYEPENSAFKGVINKTYVLTINSPDGYTYTSTPQTILPVLEPAKVYGEYSKVEYLQENNYGETTKQVKDVCNINYDYKSDTNIAPRFRFTSSQLVEYIIYKQIEMMTYSFYCWMSSYDAGLRFTNEKYATNSIDIIKQTVCTTQPDMRIDVNDIVLDTENFPDSIVWVKKDSLISVYEYKRIVKVNQYRLNSDAYQFYKGVEKQSNADGKIFDPIISQLYGNISCKTDSNKLVFGFFEASTMSTFSYSVKRNGVGTPITIKRVPNISPLPNGFLLDSIPDFWID